jgi:hypothetical protein
LSYPLLLGSHPILAHIPKLDFFFCQAIKLLNETIHFGFKADYRNRPFFRSETLTCP